MPEYDDMAASYDATRGGEPRGDEYAADVFACLPDDHGPVLEIGVGTGVVALGLVRRDRRVVGIDVSSPMIGRARERLGAVVALGDASRLPLGPASIAHAYCVWVVQALDDPPSAFAEVARVLRPGGVFAVCLTQRPTPEDVIGRIIQRMAEAIDARVPDRGPREVVASQVLEWAGASGFGSDGEVRHLERRWLSTPAQELDGISRRIWPPLRRLDEAAIEEVTAPAIDALRALPPGDCLRTMTADLVVLRPAAARTAPH
jgi:ubiquinone/menaquinone biosynthesis C-methylase UbiE